MEFKDNYVVLLEVPDHSNYPRNVFGVTKVFGFTTWQVSDKLIKIGDDRYFKLDEPYRNIRRLNDTQVELINASGVCIFLDAKKGRLVKRPKY